MFAAAMLVSHTISDFILQTGNTVRLKSKFKLRGFGYHGLALLITAVLLLIPARSDEFVVVALKTGLIICIHLFVDYLKELSQKKLIKNNKRRFLRVFLFTADQIIHLSVILLITGSTKVSYPAFDLWFLSWLNPDAGTAALLMQNIFILLYIAFSGIYLIPLIFNVLHPKQEVEEPIFNFMGGEGAGKWISVLERIIILIFILNGLYTAVAGIIALKSTIWYLIMDRESYFDRFLPGTLISAVYTISAFLILSNFVT